LSATAWRIALKVLITGGNGFIGSHLTGALARRQTPTRILCRTEQFKYAACLPAEWQRTTEMVKGDINDFDMLKELIKGVDVIFHKVASVGIVASAQNSRSYVHTNVGAQLLWWMHFVRAIILSRRSLSILPLELRRRQL